MLWSVCPQRESRNIVQFPVYLSIGPWQLHPHVVFEFLGYTVAFRLLFRAPSTDNISVAERSSVLLGGLVGALVGAKLLVLLQHFELFSEDIWQWLRLILQGKTIVGALLGGVLGVEWMKARLGITQSTGDAFVFPLIVGNAMGRIGCFLTGLEDRTYGVATTLPWGVDFGDGIARHPTQLYEIIFLWGLAFVLWRLRHQPYRSGVRFQLYLSAYLSFRLLLDFLKPDGHVFANLSAIQVACLLGLVYCGRQLYHARPLLR